MTYLSTVRAKLVRLLLCNRDGTVRGGHTDPNLIGRASILTLDGRFYSFSSISGSPGETILKYEECDGPAKVTFL
ncbi:hypothetical protein EVB39_073 [Rhizobium phage RHph_TM3_3_9]|nr:hypothetical protein EVB39_073 [Rhizobium phage RHph_TM3_3_9]QIG68594.1 hypothetical protein EVB66_073 [Rhizobium phage RHph_TM3_3_13]QIG74452.1 hypothetical protein EVC09_072 [Rhizobium phage RHph_TM3_3_10]QXV74566.1 hypothetical protein [Rhizobium phage RHEph19]